MQKISLFLTILFSSITFINAQYDIDLSGTVKNQAGYAVKNLVVKLVKFGHADTTDKDGKFSVVGNMTAIDSDHSYSRTSLRIKKGNLVITVPQKILAPTISLYSVKGSTIYSRRYNSNSSKKTFNIPLERSTRNLSSSVLIAIVKADKEVFKFRIVKSDNGAFLISSLNEPAIQRESVNSATCFQPPADDTLQFIRNVAVEGVMQHIKEFTIPINDFTDKFKVTLDLIPYEAVNLALKDYDAGLRYPTEVGTKFNQYPYDLKRYLRKVDVGPHDYEAWCSEFLSWCYRAAGYPFSGNSWMLNAHTKIESWFRSKNAHVSKNQIGSFIPAPGDFLHVTGHTAMVRYVKGTTLHTIEGNYANRITCVTRGHYKNTTGLLGYGRRSGVTGSSYESISK